MLERVQTVVACYDREQYQFKNMEKITKSFEVSNPVKVDKGYGAIVSTFTVKDLHGDRIQYGAFAKSIERLKARGGSIPVLFEHSHGLINNVGKTTFIEELEPFSERLPENAKGFGGLYVEFEFYSQYTEGQKAEQLLVDKVYQEFSVGMYVSDYEIVNESYDNFEAIIKEADLVEYSMVLRGANQYTGVTSVKTLHEKAGREISSANLSTLKDVATKISEASTTLDGIINKVDSVSENPEKEKKATNKQRRARVLLERGINHIERYKQ